MNMFESTPETLEKELQAAITDKIPSQYYIPNNTLLKDAVNDLKQKKGIVCFVGPAASGKTTMLGKVMRDANVKVIESIPEIIDFDNYNSEELVKCRCTTMHCRIEDCKKRAALRNLFVNAYKALNQPMPKLYIVQMDRFIVCSVSC